MLAHDQDPSIAEMLLSNGIAIAALIVAGTSVWLSVLLPWWRSRYARPEVKFESYSIPRVDGKGRLNYKGEERVVLRNHGPATMHEVTLKILDNKGVEITEPNFLWPEFPIKYIHVDQSFFLPIVRSFEDNEPHLAEVSWRDRKQQVLKIWMSIDRKP